MFQNLAEKGCLSWKCRMGPRPVAQFLGQSPDWYKLTLIIFLIVNPLVFIFIRFCRMAAGYRIYFHPGDGAQMLSAAAGRPALQSKLYLSG